MFLRNEHLQYIITWYVAELFYLCKVQTLAMFLMLHFGQDISFNVFLPRNINGSAVD